MKRLSLACLLWMIPATASAQLQLTAEPSHLATYLELGQGNAMVLLCCSANVEWFLSPHLSARVGAGVSIVTDDGRPLNSSLAMINGLIGGANGRYIELGVGIVHSNTGAVAQAKSRFGPTMSIGLREEKHGHFTRISLTPILPPFAGRWIPGRRFVPALGVSRGFSF